MRILVTGGAGFIGSKLVRGLLDRGDNVTVLDNLSSGSMDSLMPVLKNKRLEFHRTDLLDGGIQGYMMGVDEVWHLAARSDVRIGNEDPRIHLEQGLIGTVNVLNAMNKAGAKRLVFISSSTVYGEAGVLPTPEDYMPLNPVSLYGASKLASEAAISAHCHLFGLDATVFRLANVVGGGSRGVIHDFICKLRKDSRELLILGNGRQKKSYVHVSDCIDAMLTASEKPKQGMEVFNIASDDSIEVKRIADIVSGEMDLNPAYRFSGGPGGWKGDVPLMRLDISKIRKTGWRPAYSSAEAVRLAAREILGLTDKR